MQIHTGTNLVQKIFKVFDELVYLELLERINDVPEQSSLIQLQIKSAKGGKNFAKFYLAG